MLVVTYSINLSSSVWSAFSDRCRHDFWLYRDKNHMCRTYLYLFACLNESVSWEGVWYSFSIPNSTLIRTSTINVLISMRVHHFIHLDLFMSMLFTQFKRHAGLCIRGHRCLVLYRTISLATFLSSPPKKNVPHLFCFSKVYSACQTASNINEWL